MKNRSTVIRIFCNINIEQKTCNNIDRSRANQVDVSDNMFWLTFISLIRGASVVELTLSLFNTDSYSVNDGSSPRRRPLRRFSRASAMMCVPQRSPRGRKRFSAGVSQKVK